MLAKFEEAIVRGIEQADNVLFFISPHSVISEYCLMELKQVRKHNKRIIPILIEDTPDTDLPKGIAEIQYLNLIDIPLLLMTLILADIIYFY